MTDMLAPERRNSADPTPPKTWVEKFNIDDGERVTFYEESSDLTVSLRRGGALEGVADFRGAVLVQVGLAGSPDGRVIVDGRPSDVLPRAIDHLTRAVEALKQLQESPAGQCHE